MKNITAEASLFFIWQQVSEKHKKEEMMMKMMMEFLLLALGFLMLVKGADWFVDGTSGIADRLGVPQLVIGLTIVAMGTSMPEAAVSITAALKGSAEITIGNIVGSNILNILIILGLTAFIVPVAVAGSTIRYEIPFMIFITAVLLVVGSTGNAVSCSEGILLLLLFLGYLLYLFAMAKRDKQEVQAQENAKPMWKLLAAAVTGLVLIVWGSSVTVDAATAIAELIGLSERFIGLTIVALGTSLPELVTSVSAALKGKADIAIGNIVGSNIFNILFIVGAAALIMPVEFQPNFRIDTVVAIGAAMLLLVSVVKKKMLVRSAGIVMLMCYAGYLIYLL